MNTPKTKQQSAVDVTALLTTFPKQVGSREYFDVGDLTGTLAATLGFNGLGKNVSNGNNPVAAGVPLALASFAGAGGHVAVCTTGVYVRTAAGVESLVPWTANGAEAAIATVLGQDDVANGRVTVGSGAAATWVLSVARVDTANLTISLTRTDTTPDQQWNANVNVTGVVGTTMAVSIGNPLGVGTKHSAVAGAVSGAFCTAAAIA